MPLNLRHSSKETHSSLQLVEEVVVSQSEINRKGIHRNHHNTNNTTHKSSNSKNYFNYITRSMIGINKNTNKKPTRVYSATVASIAGFIMIASVLRATTAFSFAKKTSSASASASWAAKRFARPATAFFSTALSSSTAVAETENPLLQQDDLPKFSKIEPKDLTPAVNTLLEKLDKDFEQFENRIQTTDKTTTTTYDEILPVLERMQFGLGYTWGIAGHLNGVKNEDELRKAYEDNQPKVVQAMTKFSQSKPLYDALEAIEKEWEASGTAETEDDFETKQRKRAVEGSLLGMRLGGVGLEGEKKEKFNEMKMKLAEISTKFSNNVLDASKVFSLDITDPASLEGVPESAKAMWAQTYIMQLKAEGKEVPEMNPEAGPWRITHDMPSYIAALQHLPDRELREKIYRAYIARAGETMEDKNNVPLVYEILKIKAGMANLLGFQLRVVLSLERKVDSCLESVAELSDLILEKALPAAERELAEITAYAREQGGEEYKEEKLEKLMPWDITFWSERLKESKFDLKEEELRPYFALPNVLNGMFGLLERLFGVRVEEAKGAAEVWHPDVQFFKVFDIESNKHIASFYLDPFSRPENKRGGAWMDVCIGKSEALNRDVPVAYLTCNGSPPVGDKPSLMTFREVETLFHETGKLLAA